MTLTLHLVSPEHSSVTENLSTVSIPGSDWELEILPWHTHLISTLQSGFIKRKEAKQYENIEAYKDHEQKQEISWGIAHCLHDTVTIITS